MPELPEIEVIRRGLQPLMCHQILTQVRIYQPRLRWLIPKDKLIGLRGARVGLLERRGKYLLLPFSQSELAEPPRISKNKYSSMEKSLVGISSTTSSEEGWLILHLGMSGSLRFVPADTPLIKHDHLDLEWSHQHVLRLNDPRRFGAVLWHAKSDGPILQHPLLVNLGIEPFSPDFNAKYLHHGLRGRRLSIKEVLLSGRPVVGVGNIYASESLFLARIHPATSAEKLSLARCQRLTVAIQEILSKAIKAGGSTIRNFINAGGEAGCFQMEYQVYGRTDEPCYHCSGTIRLMAQGQRSTWFCPHCQR